jgi:hypothetical protein
MNPDELQDYWKEQQQKIKQDYEQGLSSFLPFLLPAEAVQMDGRALLKLLKNRLGERLLQTALDPNQAIPSPLAGQRNTHWMKRSNVVGINVRTIHNFWNIIKYCLTLPACNQAIHLLPIWEPGVVASLYGMASWHINPEFFSPELHQLQPSLDTVEKQLKVVINLLHADGRAVGMDVIPHTDRYAQMVLANPRHFEWLQRKDDRITDHRDRLHEAVEKHIWKFILREGPAETTSTLPDAADDFFGPAFSEANRNRILFGAPEDNHGRNNRRGMLVKHLYEEGYEPVPATMGPPYRGLEVDTDEQAKSVDGEGRIWREYRMRESREMSRVFGPLTRYKLYGRLDDNKDWEINFDEPRKETWEYVCKHFYQIQQTYNFDFMRGDMSHVQMRPQGVPLMAGPYYDLHKAVGSYIKKSKPYFAYFAETFLTGPDFMAYGSEPDHLEQSDADATLGDLQSMVAGQDRFMANFRWYLDLLSQRSFAPSFTVMTGDKDDPRFDKYYLNGNEARLFISLFLTDMPSYTALGFASREEHPEPAPNEHYTKLYVFKIDGGSKATSGPYVFGRNTQLFTRISRIRLQAEAIYSVLQEAQTRWLLPPDPTAGNKIIAWTQKGALKYFFVVNLDGARSIQNIKVPCREIADISLAVLIFSTHHEHPQEGNLARSEKHLQIERLLPGEGRIYELE